jgi:hypothetical protein
VIGNYTFINNYFNENFFPKCEKSENELHFNFHIVNNNSLDGTNLPLKLSISKFESSEVSLLELIRYPEANVEKSFLQKSDKFVQQNQCFVVTATFDEDLYIIDGFRNYRDQQIKSWNYGNFLISIYYKLGPFIAILPRKSKVAKAFFRKMLLFIHKKIS